MTAAGRSSAAAGAVNIAIAKGRVLQEALPLLAAIGCAPAPGEIDSRRLRLKTAASEVGITIVRSADVPTYVEYGATDLGIVGKDVLMEYEGDGLYEMLDLGVARCRMAVAGREGALARVGNGRYRVATKYVNSARRHFACTGRQADVIKLLGSMELAPLSGLADLIVDLVDTGDTLRANGLKELEEIAVSSARLIVNKAAMKTRQARLSDMVNRFRQASAALIASRAEQRSEGAA